MKNWLIFFNSEVQLERIKSFIRGNSTINGVFFYVINGPLRCKNNRVIGKEDEILLALNFHAYNIRPIRKIIKKEIAKIDSIIRINWLLPEELASKEEIENSSVDSYIKKAINFYSVNLLSDYLNKINFKFAGS